MLTTSGLGALLFAVSLVVLGVWWNYEELIAIALGLGVAVGLAAVASRRRLRADVERRLETVRVARGDPVRVRYRVTNETSYRSSDATLLDQLDGITSSTPVRPVRSNDIDEIEATLPTRRRGVHALGPLEVERLDPLWLAVGRWRADREGLETTVTVHPKVYDLIGPPGSSRVVENESLIRRAAMDPLSGFVSIREYVVGDDPRMIHWPTTARIGTLMVREHVEVRRPEFTLVLDTAATVASPKDFEEMVDVVATLAVNALRTSLDVVVRTTHPDYPGRAAPMRTEAEALDLLTPVQQVDGDALHVARLFEQGFDHTSVVLVTGADGPSSRLSVHDRMTVVRIGPDARPSVSVALAAVDAPDFVRQWRAPN